MSEIHAAALIGTVCVFLAYWLGLYVGRIRHLAFVDRHLMRATDYRRAVDDLDRWCGHISPHARLIARHLKAIGEGTGYNAGTPVADEACHVSGLREQLKRLDHPAPPKINDLTPGESPSNQE